MQQCRSLETPRFVIVNLLAEMEMFIRVVEYGSFAAAADASDVSATMVAKRIRHIEQRLGARLLHRMTRRQQVSEAGQLYYERSKQVLKQVAVAESAVSDLQSAPSGLLRIAAPVSFGTCSLVPALAEFMAQHPGIRVDLTLDNAPPTFSKSNYELVIHVGEVDAPGIVVRALRPYRRKLAAAPDYLARRGTPRRPEQLADHDCLGLTYWQRRDHWRLVGPRGETCDVPVRGGFTANNGEAVRAAAVKGLGITLQPEALLENDLATGRLKPVLPSWSLAPSSMYLAYTQDRRPTAKLRSAIEFLLARFGDQKRTS